MKTLKYRLKLLVEKYPILHHLVSLIMKIKIYLPVIWYSKDQRELFFLQHKKYQKLPLSQIALRSRKRVEEALHRILKEKNSPMSVSYYSNALRREVVYSFQLSIESVSKTSNRNNYLEIGSALGASLSLIGLILREHNFLGELVSIDPYFEEGYVEGSKGIWQKNEKINIDENGMQIAKVLYEQLGLDVELIRDVSSEGLMRLIDGSKKYQLIYIDGSHEGFNPLTDFALCTRLLARGGVIMLDDHYWPDVKIIKELCDRLLPKVYECWKVAAFKWEG